MLLTMTENNTIINKTLSNKINVVVDPSIMTNKNIARSYTISNVAALLDQNS